MLIRCSGLATLLWCRRWLLECQIPLSVAPLSQRAATPPQFESRCGDDTHSYYERLYVLHVNIGLELRHLSAPSRDAPSGADRRSVCCGAGNLTTLVDWPRYKQAERVDWSLPLSLKSPPVALGPAFFPGTKLQLIWERGSASCHEIVHLYLVLDFSLCLIQLTEGQARVVLSSGS